MRGFLLFVLSVCAFLPSAWAGQVDIAPFVEQDAFKNVKLSPTGDYFALSVPMGDQTGLAVMRRSDNALMTTFRFRGGTHVDDFWWVTQDRLLISIAESFGSRDEPAPTGELYAMNADGTRRELLVGWRVQSEQVGTRIKPRRREELVAAYLIDPLPSDPDHVLVAVHPLIRDPHTRVERMNIHDGRRVRVTSAPVSSARFLTDSAGVVRFAYGSSADNINRLYYRDTSGDAWRLISDQNQTGRVETALGFSEDDTIAYLRVSQPAGPDAVQAMDVASGERWEVMRDDVVDPIPVYGNGARKVVGMRFLGTKPRLAFFDESSPDAKLHRKLEDALPEHAVTILSSAKEGRLSLVLAWSDVDPGSYYVYDADSNKAELLLVRRDKVDPNAMAVMRGITLRARDGLDLHGFLTEPRGMEGVRMPLVVMPHGGPFGVYDTWSFDIDTQVLAAAGYAVLRVNFRGSGNYGRRFMESGARQWGGAMQDDLTDATRWAIAEGIADADRICIYGASYGGYASLMGVAKEPDLYRCAIGYVGVYDLPRMQGETRRIGRWASTWSREWVGDDMAQLAAMSPNRIASAIKAPVFLAAGGKDEVAPIEHTRLMERALKNAGVEVETLYYPNEGHGFYATENQREFYARLLAFLGRHIGDGRVSMN